MRVKAFPNCCVGHILIEFAESCTAGGDDDYVSETAIRNKIEVLTQLHRHHAFICVVTNNEQTRVNKVLREVNAAHSPWMNKSQHPNTKVRIWWIHIPTYLEQANESKKGQTTAEQS